MTRFAFPDLARAFREGERFGDSTMHVMEVDHLILPTGRIVACDPSYLMSLPKEQFAYTRIGPAGCYPVQLALRVKDSWPADNPNRQTVACAAVRFKEAQVERWEMALRPGWDPSTLKPGYHLGYGVDGGTGCFVDECALAHLPDSQPVFQEAFQQAHANLCAIYQEAKASPPEAMQRLAANPRWRHEMYRAYQTMLPPGLGEVLGALFDPDRVPSPGWSAVLDPKTHANIVCFRSGEGDGCYASYFGLAADGTPACLVTDFGLLVRSVMDTLQVPVPVKEQSELAYLGFAHAGIARIHVRWRPDDGKIDIDIGEALYVQDVRFENRPGSPDACSCVSGGEWTFRLAEPLQPTARILIEYTRGTEAL
jgi:hypothetical protein